MDPKNYSIIKRLHFIRLPKHLIFIHKIPTKTLSKESHYLQPGNYQVGKEVVHELKFGDIAVMQI